MRSYTIFLILCSHRKSLRAPSLVDELLNEIYSRFSSMNGETTSDMSSPYHYGTEFGARDGAKFGVSRYKHSSSNIKVVYLFIYRICTLTPFCIFSDTHYWLFIPFVGGVKVAAVKILTVSRNIQLRVRLDVTAECRRKRYKNLTKSLDIEIDSFGIKKKVSNSVLPSMDY